MFATDISLPDASNGRRAARLNLKRLSAPNNVAGIRANRSLATIELELVLLNGNLELSSAGIRTC